jgi:hypothetical protein
VATKKKANKKMTARKKAPVKRRATVKKKVAANKKVATKKRDPNQLTITQRSDEDHAGPIARAMLMPTAHAAVTLKKYGKSLGNQLDLQGLVDSLSEQTKAVNDGDLGRGEAMLVAQAHTLDVIFNYMAQRASLNMDEYLGACDTYLKLALRAQSQCRATWETLATIKNPPIMGYVKQANITQGPQQVNNGVAPVSNPSRTRENQNPQNKLLEEKNGERLDFGTTKTTSSTDPEMATVGEIDRAKVNGG